MRSECAGERAEAGSGCWAVSACWERAQGKEAAGKGCWVGLPAGLGRLRGKREWAGEKENWAGERERRRRRLGRATGLLAREGKGAGRGAGLE